MALQTVSLYPSTKGLVTSLDPLILTGSMLTQADNIVFTTNFARKKRGGQSYFDNAAAVANKNFRALIDYWFIQSTAQVQKPVGVCDTKVFKMDSLDGTWDDITGAAVITTGTITNFEIFQDKLYIFFDDPNVVIPKEWNGTGNITNVPETDTTNITGAFGRGHRNRLYMAGNKNYPHRLFFSKTLDGDNWVDADAGSFDVKPGDGDPIGITAIFPSFFGDLYVAKRTKLYKITGTDDTTAAMGGKLGIEVVSSTIGCVAHSTAVSIGNDIFFCSEANIWRITPSDQLTGVQLLPIGDMIQKSYNTDLDKNMLTSMKSVYIPEMNSYFIGCAENGYAYNNVIYGFNILLGEWFKWVSVEPISMARIRKANNTYGMYLGRTNGRVAEIGISTLTDFGSAIVSTFKTGVIYPDPTNPRKMWEFLRMACIFKPKGNYTFTVTYKIDNYTPGTITFNQLADGNDWGTLVWGADLWGSSDVIQPVENPIEGHGRGIQFTFIQSGASQDIELYGFMIEVEQEGYNQEVNLQTTV